MSLPEISSYTDETLSYWLSTGGYSTLVIDDLFGLLERSLNGDVFLTFTTSVTGFTSLI